MKTYKKVLNGFAISVALASFAMVIRILLYPEIAREFQTFLYFVSIFVIALYISGFYLINTFFSRKLPFTENVPLRILLQLVTGWIYVVILRLTMFYFFKDLVPFTITKYFTTTVFILDFFISIAFNAGFFASHFFKEWKQSLIRTQQLEKEKMQVQYDSLKNQLNPHFLFNTLTSLNSLIFENQDLASQYLKHLSKLYRYLLENKEVVSLERDLSFLENYLFILKTRFGNALLVDQGIKKEDLSLLVVPVTLQNLIENAIKHNIINTENPLKITIRSGDGYIIIKNNVQRKRIVENSNKKGLQNMKLLYKYLTNKEVLVEENDKYYEVKIPLIK